MNRPALSLVVFFALLTCATTARAQALANGTLRQCLEASPVKDLRRVAVFLRSDVSNSAPSLEKPADLLVETLGEALRTYLGAKTSDLPVGEPAFTRSNTSGRLMVTLHRDGRLGTAIQLDSAETDSSRIGGIRLLASILRKSWDDGDRVFWPESARGDSGTFRIEIWKIGPRRDASQPKVQTRFAVAAFSIALPWEQPAEAVDEMKTKYPIRNLDRGIEGTIVLSFVVDTTGYALISTAYDVFPPHAMKPVGEMADSYRDFVRAAAEVLPKARFRPALIAGCKVQQRVNLPFSFKLRDASH
ncbi:MAG: energy transducer TonB [Gemmatimonadota bacterium]|nr:energy transducer TonB [Gemmatimonadota bacterium]